ncbi:GNAT family N-acetyltransferase [Hymenobacter sp. BT186]|uniref:GNAT family N-acetyltransferase n=1 Tax=Hymenobacter telluris TaxID=2816474 RepID=A0A939JC88_9BACT|nr:GNAT family N-acetyltransferase [Hymenobacter telluris]MBO0357568.1 GNAT family N-acetyltransferase [Hymenobacter telluris]MBW3373594.1 GNAT family N-acetyltransferase [Hymenobacter norwichensis]
MKIVVETERLVFREFLPTDAQGMFELDSDPEVHRYLGNKPVLSIEQSQEMIAFIRQQYLHNGIGRWAVIKKASNEFIGWAGLKLVREPINHHVDFYDVGYRFIRRYWGQGFATEAAQASVAYGFRVLRLPTLYAMADMQNLASRAVLAKAGLHHVGVFNHNGVPTAWLEATRPALETVSASSFS